MELFKFTPNNNLLLTDGWAIQGKLTSVMWTERYRDAGEFEIVAPLSSGLREFLPLGSIISHINTLELMMVENHQIKDDGESTPSIVITGRSLEAFLENRIIGGAETYPLVLSDYTLPSTVSLSAQVVGLIQDHILGGQIGGDLLGTISDIRVTHTNSGAAQSSKTLKRRELYKEILELLALDDLGIAVKRPTTDQYTRFHIHNGVDKSSSVVFSWQVGDLDDAEYLWSNKKLRHDAIVVGRWIAVRTSSDPSLGVGYNRRTMIVDATDLDEKYNAAPTSPQLEAIQAQMLLRGEQALANQKLVVISRVDISSNARFRYRSDYNIGDIVRVDGNYGAIATMRVIEHVEIHDENGSSSHPTLAIYDPS